MRTPITIVAAIAAAFVVAACSSAASSPGVSLPGTSWTVISIAGAATVPDAQPTINFGTDGTVSGNATCNQYNGPYTVDGDKLTVGPTLAQTLMLCTGDGTAEQEQAFTLALTGATNWSILGSGDLEIKGASTIVAKPGAGAASAAGGDLAGTSWVLSEIPGVEMTALGDSVPTITFAADGSASGSAGCNTFNAGYTVDGESITFDPPASTRMACPEAQTAVETAFLAALEGTTTWSIEAETLTLTGPDATLTFTPA